MAKGDSNSLSNKSRSSKPYDVTNSFVKQVKDRMTSYLPRFGLFSPPVAAERETAAPAPSGQNNESSSEDDETSSQQFAPPKKRARSELNQPLPFENVAASTPNPLYSRVPAPDFIDGTIAGPSGISRRSCLASSTPAIPQRYHHAEEPNFIQASEPLGNGDNDSNSSMSTSGCSSLIPQAKNQAENRSSTSVNNRSAQRRGCFGDRDLTTLLQTSRSMLDGSGARANSAASSRRPSFNASVFSAPSTSPAESVGRSPFYAGRTQFGGASSYRRPRGALFTPLDAVSPTARHTVQAKPFAGSSAMDWGSCTARKILDTLDHLSSPVLDAKRIPSSPVLAGQSRKRAALDSSPPSRHGPGPAAEGLTVPTVQDLLKMQRQNQMRDSMEAARKVALSPAHNPAPSLTETEKAYRARLDADRERPSGGKMTSKMRTLEAEMSPAAPRLPTVALNMAHGLPTFAQDHRTAKPSRFIFARPTPLDAPEFDLEAVKSRAPAKKPALNNNSVDVKSRVAVAPPSSSMLQFSTFSTSAKPREKSGFAEISKAAAQNGKVGFPAAPELRTGSVMDVLGKKPSPATPSGFGAQFAPPAGSWACDSCMVRNKAEAVSCVSCATARSWTKAPTGGFGTQFAPAAGSWTCDTCMVLNKAEAAACVSCEAPKPGAKPATGFGSAFKPATGLGQTLKPTTGFGEALKPTTGFGDAFKPTTTTFEASKPSAGFGTQFKAAAGSWECAACMVRNDPGAVACVSCETARPKTTAGFGATTAATGFGSASTTGGFGSVSTATAASGFGSVFTTTTTSGFGAAAPTVSPKPLGFGPQFGAPAATWECPSCLVRNGNGSVACIACEMRKPDVRGFMAKPAEKPTTSFGSLSTTTVSGFGSTPSPVGFGTVSPATTTSGFVAANPTSTGPVTTGFGAAFAKPSGSWDCDACMLRNASGDSCAACEAARPGAAPFKKPTAVATPTFAFGVDKAGPNALQPTATGFSFGANAPAPPGSFTFGIPAKSSVETAKPASPADSADRKRKGDDEGDGRAAKATFGGAEPLAPAATFAFGAAKSNGPVATTAANVLFAFGSSTAKPGSGFGPAVATTNPFNATATTTASGSFTTAASSIATTANAFTKTTSSFTTTTNMFAPANNAKPAANLFSTSESSTPATNFFATTANSTTAAASPFTTAAPSAVFAFGSTQAKPAPVTDSAPRGLSFGAGFGDAKSAGFGALAAPSIGFPASNAAAPSTGFGGAAAAKTAAPPFSSTPFVFGQAAKAAESAFPSFGAPAETKGFNFSAAPATNASTGFGFTAVAPAAPSTFAFSAAPAAAPTGAFAFGQPTAFNPSAQPKFDFTGGDVPLFTAAGAPNPATTGPRRIIKKAVRRGPVTRQ